MKINVSVYDGQWFDFNDEVSFKIVPMSYSKIIAGGINKDDIGIDLLCTAIKDWKGITDLEGKPLKPTLKNKKIVLDQSLEIYEFIDKKIGEIHKKLNGELKN